MIFDDIVSTPTNQVGIVVNISLANITLRTTNQVTSYLEYHDLFMTVFYHNNSRLSSPLACLGNTKQP